MRRRAFLGSAGATIAALSGCTGDSDDSGDGSTPTSSPTETESEGEGTPTGTAEPSTETVTVATYESFVDGSDPAGPWLKEAFEAEHDAEIDFRVPDNGVNQYIQRARQGADVEADLFVGLNVDEMIRIDERLDDPLFDGFGGDLERSDRIHDYLRFDPEGRAVPYDTGYVTLVYDETEAEPTSFEDLTDSEHEGQFITQNAQQSDPGLAFLLWTIHEFDEGGYLDYWQELEDNGVRILGSWSDAYNAYLNEEADMVVSYSTDQVYNGDEPRHQIGFLEDQGYAQPEGMARFADAASPEAARELMAFVLTPEAQGQIAEKNVQFPAVDDADLDEGFAALAHEPPEPVSFGYEELAGNLEGWIDDWARQVVQ
jgi:thiamine transport system substrate-binding protein